MPELTDPDQAPERDVVVYDGQCRFCRRGVEALARLDLGQRRLSFISLHDPRIRERYPDLTHEQLMEQMYVIDTAGRRHGGSDAVKFLSRRLPILWATAPVLHLPGTAKLWRWGYHQVAKRRYRLAGRAEDQCNDDACAIHLNR